MSWINRDRDWKNANSLIKWRCGGHCCHGILNSLIIWETNTQAIANPKSKCHSLFVLAGDDFKSFFLQVPNSIILLKITHTTKYMDVCPNHMLEFKFLLHLNRVTTEHFIGLRNYCYCIVVILIQKHKKTKLQTSEEPVVVHHQLQACPNLPIWLPGCPRDMEIALVH